MFVARYWAILELLRRACDCSVHYQTQTWDDSAPVSALLLLTPIARSEYSSNRRPWGLLFTEDLARRVLGVPSNRPVPLLPTRPQEEQAPVLGCGNAVGTGPNIRSRMRDTVSNILGTIRG